MTKSFLQKEGLSIILIFFFATLGNRYGSSLILKGVVLLIAFCILTSNVEHAFCWAVLLVPNIRLLNGIGYSFIVNILMALPLVNYLFQFRKISKTSLIGFLSLLGMELVHDLVLCKLNNFTEILGWTLNILLCTVILTDPKVHVSKDDVFSAFSIGIIFSALSYILSTSSSISFIIRTSTRFVGFAGEPNYYALYICLAIACILSVSGTKGYKFTVLILLMGIGFLTASKMCILLMAVELLMIYAQAFNNAKENRKNKRFLLVTLIGFLIVAVIFRKYLIIVLQTFIRRLGQNFKNGLDLSTLTTKRTDIYLEYLKIIFSNLKCLFWGYGLRYNLYLGMSTGQVAHSTYFDVLLSWGVVGSIIFFVLVGVWVSSFKQARGITKVGAIRLIPIIVLLINFLDLSCLSAGMFAFVVTIALLQWLPDSNLVEMGAQVC